MASLLVTLILFLISFYVMIKAADFFIDEAAVMGKLLGMSKLLIGLTIVAIGTSLPELVTAISSIITSPKFADFVVGTVLGSNITNILLAFGIFLIVAGSFTIRKKETFNVLALMGTSIFMSIFIIVGEINQFILLLVMFFIYYLYHVYRYEKAEILSEEENLVDEPETKRTKSQSTLYLIISFILLFLSANGLIYSIENFARILSIPTAYLTLTTIAIGTSLPEIVVTVAAAKKKEYMMAIGNVVGSNIMNICLVVGLTGFYGTYVVDSALYSLYLFFFLFSTLIFSIFLLRKKFEGVLGWFFIIMYGVFLLSFFV